MKHIKSLLYLSGLGSNEKINLENYNVLIHKIGFINLSPELQKGHQFLLKKKDELENNPILRETIEDYINDLNAFVGKLPKEKQAEIFKPEDKGYSGNKFTGKNYSQAKNLSTKEIAKLIKEELKVEFPEDKFSVSSDVYSGGASINVTVTDISFNPFSEIYQKHLTLNDNWYDYRYNGNRYPDKYNEKAKKFNDKIDEIANQYNFNDSDAMTDYFSVNYYAHVGIDDVKAIKKYFPDNIDNNKSIERNEEWDKKASEKNAKAKMQKGKYKKSSIVYFKPKNVSYKGVESDYFQAIVLRSPNGRSAFSSYDIKLLIPFELLSEVQQKMYKGFEYLGKKYVTSIYAGIYEQSLLPEYPKPEPVKKNTNTVMKSTKIVQKKAKTVSKQKQTGKLVEKIDEAVVFIKRFALMNGKVKTDQQIHSLLTGLQKAILERRIRKGNPYEKEIKQIQDSLILAYKTMGTATKIEIEIDPDNLKKYLAISNSQHPMKSITLLKRYVNLQGRTGVKEKATKLMLDIIKAMGKGKVKTNDKYRAYLEGAVTSLTRYTEGQTKTLLISQPTLNGLEGLGIVTGMAVKGSRRMKDGRFTLPIKKGKAKWKGHGSKHGGLSGSNHTYKGFKIDHYTSKCGDGWGFVISAKGKASYNSGILFPDEQKSRSIAEQKIDESLKGLGNPILIALVTGAAATVGAKAADKALKGVGMTVAEIMEQKFEPLGLEEPFLGLIGNASKPTHFFIYGPGGSGKSSLSLKLSAQLNKIGAAVAYVAGEQFASPTFQETLKRLEIKDTGTFIFFPDLKSFNPKQFDIVVFDSKDSLDLGIDQFRDFKKSFPHISTITTSQGKKDGSHRGSEEWRNEVDTMIKCENNIAKTAGQKNRWGAQSEMKIS